MTEPSAGQQELARYALGILTPLDRRLWGRSVAKAIQSPSSYLRQSLPKMGFEAAVYLHAARMWGLSMALVFVVIPLEFAPANIAGVAVVVGFAYLLFAFVMCYRKIWRSYRYKRLWKRGEGGGAAAASLPTP